MTKKELVDLIADKRDLSAQMVLTVVEYFMKIIQSSVADGQRIFLRGFGVFQPKERKAKVGRNITRGEQLSIPPKRVPQFRPYPHFKKVVEPAGHRRKPAPSALPGDQVIEEQQDDHRNERHFGLHVREYIAVIHSRLIH